MFSHRTIYPNALAAFFGVILLLGPGSPPAQGTTVTVLDASAKMPFDPSVTGNRNGWDLDVHGGFAVIGGPGNYEPGVPRGCAQIFYNSESTGWTHQATLDSTDSNLDDDDKFGYAVGIDQYNQSMAVVGARGNNTVYVFDRSGDGDTATWAENTAARLFKPDDDFGVDIGVSNGRIIVGTGEGKAWIYTQGAWNDPFELTPGTPDSSFGSSVAISGDYAVVGASYSETAYFFRFDGSEWVEEGAVPKPGTSFGSCVSIFGDRAIVGGPAADGLSGMAAIYRRDAGGTWIEEDILTASDGVYADYHEFGCSVDISENRAIVGAAEAYGTHYASYVFGREGSTWLELEKLIPQDGDWGDQFASAVGVDEGGSAVDYVVGAWARDSETGAAYVHQKEMPETWRPGDANRDHKVDAADAAILADNWLNDDGVNWDEGDFNADGIVDAADATLMATNWLYGVGTPATVPEPPALVLLTLALLGLAMLKKNV